MDLELVGPDEWRPSCDEGYTLVEVVVALVLVMILVISAAKVLMTATARAAVLQQQQTAPLVANQTMERVKAVTALPTASLVTGLVQGRSNDDVTAQWNAAAGVPVVTSVLASAWPAADPGAAGGSSGAVVPLQSLVTVGATTYTVATYLGVCDVPHPATAAASCTKQAEDSSAAAPAGYVRMVRALVEVSWTGRPGSGCPHNRCSYTISSLVDPSPDLTWNPNATSTSTSAGNGS